MMFKFKLILKFINCAQNNVHTLNGQYTIEKLVKNCILVVQWNDHKTMHTDKPESLIVFKLNCSSKKSATWTKKNEEEKTN